MKMTYANASQFALSIFAALVTSAMLVSAAVGPVAQLV
jgi:hypothetical protein